jgi:hypothetical protein
MRRIYRPKPKQQDKATLTAAQYQPGKPLAELVKVAAMAFNGEVAECPLPSGPVLVAAWLDVPDDYAARTCYEEVKPGEWLCFSSDYGALTASDDQDLAHWYDLVKEL